MFTCITERFPKQLHDRWTEGGLESREMVKWSI
jgi:hypothetical protein